MRYGNQRRHVEYLFAAWTGPVLCCLVDASRIGGNRAAYCGFVASGACKKQFASAQIRT